METTKENNECGKIFIDWEERRYEIAKAAMQAYISQGKWDKNAITRMAVQDADRLINELKKSI
jgi:hypothetical protein